MADVDLHCHLLPGVDDGPATLEESVAYARAAAAAGTGTIVATPHVELVDVRELPDRVHELRAALAEEGIPLTVEVGGELKPMSLGELTQGDLELIAHGPAGAPWLLYEVPFAGATEDFVAGAHELLDRGFGLLLAHPERSRGFHSGTMRALEPLLARGAQIETNVGPLEGREGSDREDAAGHLLRRGLVDVIATDAHAPKRPYTLAMGRAAVVAVTGDAALADALAAGTPARLLGEGMPAAPRVSWSG